MNNVKEYLQARDDQDKQLLILYKIFKSYDLDGNNQIDKRECIPFFMDFLKGRIPIIIQFVEL